jgi:ribA/ribD-fused uncharacterized protein
MMHQKALTFNDEEIAKEVLEEINPREHKVLGRKIKGFDKSVWDKVCLSIVYKGNLHKFKQNPDLLQQLKDTENRMLVEASPLDNIWGIGMAENDEGVENPINWKGLNLLGQAINLVKQEIL